MAREKMEVWRGQIRMPKPIADWLQSKAAANFRSLNAELVELARRQKVYESTAVALSDGEYRKQVLQQAHSELGAVARKYRELKELSEVLVALDKVGDMLKEEQPQS